MSENVRKNEMVTRRLDLNLGQNLCTSTFARKSFSHEPNGPFFEGAAKNYHFLTLGLFGQQNNLTTLARF
jgi:hypothetical protein